MADQGIIGEPPLLKSAATGPGQHKIVTRGRRHSSVPEKGINASTRWRRSSGLRRLQPGAFGADTASLCGHGRSAGVIHGGVQVNMVPDCCELEVDRPDAAGRVPSERLCEFHERIRRRPPATRISFTRSRAHLVDRPTTYRRKSVVAALRAAHQDFRKDSGWRPLWPLGRALHGFPTVICGPGHRSGPHHQ